MILTRKWPFLVAALALGLGAVVLLKSRGSGFTDSEGKALERETRKRLPPDESACVSPPLDGESRDGPGSALLLEALDPDGPHKSCYELVKRLSIDDHDALYPPARSVSAEGQAAWEVYWQNSDTPTETELRLRCDSLVRSLEKAVNYDEVCAPGSWDHIQSQSTANRVTPLLLRSLMREGRDLEAAKLGLSLLRAQQSLGHGQATWLTSMIAFARTSVLDSVTEIALSKRLTEEERSVVHGQLLRLLKSIPSPAGHAEFEEASMLLEHASDECNRECLTARYVLVALRDSRDKVCEGLDYLACANAWKTWADELTPKRLPASLPSIADSKLRTELQTDVSDQARSRSKYILKIAQYYAALVALELALRSQGQSCPAEAIDNQLGVSLAVDKKEGWVSLALPQELQIRSGETSAAASHLLSFPCAQVAPQQLP